MLDLLKGAHMGDVDWGMVSGLAGVLALVVAAFTLVFYLWHRGVDKLEAQFLDPRDHDALRSRLNDGAAPGRRWLDSLQHLNDWLDGPFFGGPAHGWSAFIRCFQIAFLYPMFLTLLAWVLSGDRFISDGTFLFFETSGFFDRIWRICLLLGLAVAFFLRMWFIVANRFSELLRPHAIASTLHNLSKGQKQLLVSLAAILAFASLGSLVYAYAGVVAFAGAFGYAIVGAGAVGVVNDRAFVILVASIIIFLYALLPLLNAVLDWLSWAVTRRLLRAAATKTKADRWAPLWLAAELLIDLLFALVCLVVLAALLALAFESRNQFGSGVPWDWRNIAEAAARAPFTEGILVTGMLATTFVPTLLHLGFGFYGLHLAFAPDQSGIRALLRRGNLSVGEANWAARQMMRVRFNVIYAIPGALAVLLVFFALFYYPVLWIFGGYSSLFLGAATGAVDVVFGADLAPD